jgi:hypothetical protein
VLKDKHGRSSLWLKTNLDSTGGGHVGTIYKISADCAFRTVPIAYQAFQKGLGSLKMASSSANDDIFRGTYTELDGLGTLADREVAQRV